MSMQFLRSSVRPSGTALPASPGWLTRAAYHLTLALAPVHVGGVERPLAVAEADRDAREHPAPVRVGAEPEPNPPAMATGGYRRLPITR